MSTVSTEAESIQAQVTRYLTDADRNGDADRMAQRIALAHSRGSRVVGFRRAGRELFVYEERSDGANRLAIDAVARDGRLRRTATVWTGRSLESWLAENHHYLEWIAPRWR